MNSIEIFYLSINYVENEKRLVNLSKDKPIHKGLKKTKRIMKLKEGEIILEISKFENTEKTKKMINKIEDSYDLPIITCIIERYSYDLVFKIYDLIKDKKYVKEALFSHKGDCTHPIERVYLYKLSENIFDFITKCYDRNFNLIHIIETYSEVSCILQHIFEEDLVTGLLEDLNKYKVTKEEFDYDYLIKYCKEYEKMIYIKDIEEIKNKY